MGGRGSGGGKRSGASGGGNQSATTRAQNRWKTNPASAPIQAKLEMGGYTYKKVGNNSWYTTGPNGKRVKNRTDADIKRVFS